MPKAVSSPLLGYNNNVRHKDRVFHIQTEDSGVKHPHVITHLFMDGGRIVKSVKRSYAEHVGTEGMAELVRQMMKEQHKAMFMALRAGRFDPIIEAPLTEAPPSSRGGLTEEPPKHAATLLGIPIAPRVPSIDTPHDTTKEAVVAAPLTLDFGALERAVEADAASGRSALYRPSDLPPPPPNLFRERGSTGKYKTVHPTKPEQSAESPRRGAVKPRSASNGPATTNANPSPRKSSAKARYAPASPPAIFTREDPLKATNNATDNSLDEVILSYLGEDLEPPSDRKK